MLFPAIIAAVSLFQAQPTPPGIPPLLVSIEVTGDRGNTRDHRIDITPQDAGMPKSAEVLAQRAWVATRTIDGQSETITSQACPPLSHLAASFGKLPPIPISPMGLQFGESLPLGPQMKDGFYTTLSFLTRLPDNSWARVNISGGTFRIWGHEAVTALLPCWEALGSE